MTQPLPALQTGKETVTAGPAARVTVVWLWVSLLALPLGSDPHEQPPSPPAHSRGTQMALGSPSVESGEHPEPPCGALPTGALPHLLEQRSEDSQPRPGPKSFHWGRVRALP